MITIDIHCSWGNISEAFKGKVALYEAFKGWVKPVLYAACAWVSWIILFDHIYKLHDSSTEVASKAKYTDRVCFHKMLYLSPAHHVSVDLTSNRISVLLCSGRVHREDFVANHW